MLEMIVQLIETYGHDALVITGALVWFIFLLAFLGGLTIKVLGALFEAGGWLWRRAVAAWQTIC